MAFSTWPKEQPFIVGIVVGLIVGGLGCIFVLIGVAGIMLGVLHLLGVEHASHSVQTHILLFTYVALRADMLSARWHVSKVPIAVERRPTV